MKAILLSAALAVSLAVPALGQSSRNCGPRDQVVDRLATGYGEARQTIGVGSNNSIVEVFASEKTGTWTITVTTPQGLTCLVASGQNFEVLLEELPQARKDL